MNKNEILDNFIKNYIHLPSQGTTEWALKRRSRIGGSEISTVLNKNKHNTIKKLIFQRTNLSSFNGNIMTMWGNIFECIIQKYSEKLFNCKIYETGSIAHDSNLLAYSPDGLSVIENKNLLNFVNDNNKNKNDKSIILFEFKCPFKRIPTEEVPEYYIYQPKIGMEIINICDYSLFIQAIFRISSINDLIYNNEYNNRFHKDKEPFEDNPLLHGMILFYVSKDLIDEEISSFIKSIGFLFSRDYYIHDLGKITNWYMLNKVFELYFQKKIQLKYIYTDIYLQEKFSHVNKIIYDLEVNFIVFDKIKKIKEELKEENTIIGVLPYKLMKTYSNPVFKEDLIINTELLSKVENILNIIKTVNKDDNELDDNEKKKFITNELKNLNLK